MKEILPTLTRRHLLIATLAAPVCSISHQKASAQTPAPEVSGDPTLRDYLAMIPTSVANLEQGVAVLMGNALLQATALGIAFPFDYENEEQRLAWAHAAANVTTPEVLRRLDLRMGLSDTLGFDPGQIYSGVETGALDRMVTIARGEFDRATVETALQAADYQRMDVDGQTVFHIDFDGLQYPPDSFDSIPARLFNAVMLEDGTLVFAPYLEQIEHVLAPESTLIDLPAVDQAATTLDELLIAAALAGPSALLPQETFELAPPTDPDEVQALWPQESPMPLAAIVGSTAGGPIEQFTDGATPLPAPNAPVSRSKLALVYSTPQEADAAAGQIEDRLATGTSASLDQPWSELFAGWTVETNASNASVLVSIEWAAAPSHILILLYRRDLGFVTG